jgi:hypothetical protein
MAIESFSEPPKSRIWPYAYYVYTVRIFVFLFKF